VRAGRVRRSIRAGFLVVALAACGLVIWRNGEEFAAALDSMSVASLLAAFGAALVAGFIPMFGWQTLLAGLGSRLPTPAAARIYFVSQLGKFVPGSLWAVLGQVELSREYRVPASRSGAAALLVVVTSAFAALLVVALAWPFSAADVRRDYGWVVLLILPLLAMLHPASVRWWSGLAFRLLRRSAPPVQPRAGAVIRSVLIMFAAWLLYGLHLYVLVLDAAPAGTDRGLPLLLQCAGVFALAWVAGLVLVFLPAGAGVREVIIVLGLASVLPSAAALLAALVSRLMLTAIDLLLAGLAAAHHRPRASRGRRLAAGDDDA
jgi:uncharacterized membrane protein YbhN (UPF0104 family)